MNLKQNPHISVDCVIFGLDYKELKVVLVEREFIDSQNQKHRDFKLVGDLILETELLDEAAYRVLRTLTGLESVFLKKFEVFDALDRMQILDKQWINTSSGLETNRIITVAYYALIKLDENIISETQEGHKVHWVNVNEVKSLAFDHLNILNSSLEHLRKELRSEPVVFELLPEHFSIRQVQNFYEIVLGMPLDNRNFRKKFLKLPYIEQTQEKEQNVNHKPAWLYKVNREIYTQTLQSKNDFLL